MIDTLFAHKGIFRQSMRIVDSLPHTTHVQHMTTAYQSTPQLRSDLLT